ALVKKLYADAMSKGQINQASRTNASGAAVPLPTLYQRGEPEHGATALMRTDNAPAAASTPAAAAADKAKAVADPFEDALLNSLPVGEAEFRALAADRAKTVREYLLQNGKVEAE